MNLNKTYLEAEKYLANVEGKEGEKLANIIQALIDYALKLENEIKLGKSKR